jgi:hypothetical protein
VAQAQVSHKIRWLFEGGVDRGTSCKQPHLEPLAPEGCSPRSRWRPVVVRCLAPASLPG